MLTDKDIERYQIGFGDGYKAGKERSVAHGTWVEKEEVGKDWYTPERFHACSVCGKKVYHKSRRPIIDMFKFCPNCGAKMGFPLSTLESAPPADYKAEVEKCENYLKSKDGEK